MKVPMEYQMDSKTWSATVMMPQASRFKFKLSSSGAAPRRRRRGGARAYWQEGDDRFVQLPFDDALSLDIVIDWRAFGEGTHVAVHARAADPARVVIRRDPANRRRKRRRPS